VRSDISDNWSMYKYFDKGNQSVLIILKKI